MDSKAVSRSQRRKNETHARLIQAAVDLIIAKGYQEVTIQDITDLADYSRATFYLHFDDIESLIWEYFNDVWQDHAALSAKLEGEAAGDSPPLYFEILADFLLAQENRAFYRVIFSGSSPATVYDETKHNLVTDMEERIRRYPDLAPRGVPPHLAAHYLFGATTQSIVWWLEEDNSFSPQEMAQMLYELMTGRR